MFVSENESPLIVLLLHITAIKEAFDDYNRYKRDKIANERLYWVLDSRSGEKREVCVRAIHICGLCFTGAALHCVVYWYCVLCIVHCIVC